MVYGVVKNGVIEIEGSLLREGTRVRVEPVDQNAAERGSPKAILDRLQPWSGDDLEWDALEEVVRQLRDQDLKNDRLKGL